MFDVAWSLNQALKTLLWWGWIFAVNDCSVFLLLLCNMSQAHWWWLGLLQSHLIFPHTVGGKWLRRGRSPTNVYRVSPPRSLFPELSLSIFRCFFDCATRIYYYYYRRLWHWAYQWYSSVNVNGIYCKVLAVLAFVRAQLFHPVWFSSDCYSTCFVVWFLTKSIVIAVCTSLSSWAMYYRKRWWLIYRFRFCFV